MSLLSWVLGRRLANQEFERRKINAIEGVPAMGLDGLGSSSYGPEAALTFLIPLGALGLAYIWSVMLPILVLLIILYVSYRQTIRAYPSNGGAYTVAKENLGTYPSLLAASALLIDYVLNVAVGISAGIGALISAMPSLQSYILELCLGILAVITFANLRGTGEASRAWAIPTYLFVASFFLILAIGIYRTILSGEHPEPIVAPPPLPEATQMVGLWLLLHSFSAGCTAMTGVEAVSNGVSAFSEPVVKRAHHTLGAICAILGVLLAGIAYLAQAYSISAMDQTQPGYQSVLSQLAAAITGRGTLYYIAIGSALCILCLSANTSFVDFPRVCRLVAADDFLPRAFATVGRRLVYSVGIIFLAVSAGLLLFAFGGITDRLIPLFAVGAFLTFTMSQLGMVVHWRRELSGEISPRDRHRHRTSLAINALGTILTALALVIIVVSKFMEGAWITILVIPCIIVLLIEVKRYYTHLDSQIHDNPPLDIGHLEPPVVLVTTEGWNKLTDRAISFAMRLSPDVAAIHLTALAGPEVDEKRNVLRVQWATDVEEPAQKAGLRPPQLIFLQAPFRRMQVPFSELIRNIKQDYPNRVIAILIPSVVKEHWWQYLLHTHRAWRLRSALLRHGGSQVVVISIPWYLEEPQIESALNEGSEEVAFAPQTSQHEASLADCQVELALRREIPD